MHVSDNKGFIEVYDLNRQGSSLSLSSLDDPCEFPISTPELFEVLENLATAPLIATTAQGQRKATAMLRRHGFKRVAKEVNSNSHNMLTLWMRAPDMPVKALTARRDSLDFAGCCGALAFFNYRKRETWSSEEYNDFLGLELYLSRRPMRDTSLKLIFSATNFHMYVPKDQAV